MDILYFNYPDNNAEYVKDFNQLVNEISVDHAKLVLEDQNLFHLWQSKSGESLFHKTNRFDIWFDGYVFGTNQKSLADYLELLAGRIVEQGEVLAGDETGIFNIIINDKQTKKVYLANDPGGLFPLYYAYLNGTYYTSTH